MKKSGFFTMAILFSFLVTGCTRDFYGNNEPYIDGWIIKSSEIESNIHTGRLFFVSPSNGYMIGYSSSIYHTMDSGESWIPQNSGATLPLKSIYFFNETIGFISSEGWTNCLDPDCDKGSLLLKTTDGGEHWSKIFYDSLAYLESMQFRDENNGIAVMKIYQRPNSRFKLLVKTTDGGITWSKTDINVAQTSFSNKIINIENVYYLIGEERNLLKSTDYGQSWQSFDTPIEDHSVYDLYFCNKDIGFIINKFKVYKTDNGGLAWQQVDNDEALFEQIHFSDENNGFCFSPLSVYEGGYFASPKGTYIYSTNDGGLTWDRSELFKKFSRELLVSPLLISGM